jgi:hypothetical protein
VPTINGNILHWGLAFEYSTLYLTDRFPGGSPKEEPLNQLVPLVEFAFDTPMGRGFGRKTTGTANTWTVVRSGDLAAGGRGYPSNCPSG